MAVRSSAPCSKRYVEPGPSFLLHPAFDIRCAGWHNAHIWSGRGGFLQSRHLVGPLPAAFSSRAVARIRSLAWLALARRLASSFRRRCRCFSAQVSHLVWPGIAGLEQSLHLPVSLANRICSLRSCRLYSFRSGVWLLARSYSLRSSGVCLAFAALALLTVVGLLDFVKSGAGLVLGGFPERRRSVVFRRMAADAAALSAGVGLDWDRRRSGKVCWKVILLEYCAGARS